jgi:hypothetical protein
MKTNETEDPEINPQSYSHLIFDNIAPKVHLRIDSFFKKRNWENWLSTSRRLKLDPDLLPCTKIIQS